MPIVPMRKKVLINPIFPPEQSQGGIWIPDQAQSKCNQGIVEQVGEGCTQVEVGDYVFFSGYTGTFIAIENRVNILVPERFIMLVLRDIEYNVPGLYIKDDEENYLPAPYDFVADMLSLGGKRFMMIHGLKNLETIDTRPSPNELFLDTEGDEDDV